MTSHDALILIHRIVGYPTVFVIAPLALLAFTQNSVHRRWGKFYLYGMFFLYLTGTYVTLTTHDWRSWEFARNVAFNFFGFSMLLYAWRAIWLFTRRHDVAVERTDLMLAGLLTANVAALLAIGIIGRDRPMLVLATVGVVLLVLEWRDLRPGALGKPVLYRRHQRYILASYFYVLTVVSIVHLGNVLPRDVKWLWPSVVAAIAIYLLTEFQSRLVSRARMTRYVVWSVVLLAIVYSGYVAYDVMTGDKISAQGSDKDQTVSSSMTPDAK